MYTNERQTPTAAVAAAAASAVAAAAAAAVAAAAAAAALGTKRDREGAREEAYAGVLLQGASW